MFNNSYFGDHKNALTTRFCDIWDSDCSFHTDYTTCGLTPNMKPTQGVYQNVKNLFYLLYAKYGNSYTLSSDINRFKMCVFTTIWKYGPQWERKLEVQQALRSLTEEQLSESFGAVYNHALYNGSEPSTDILEAIDSQNTTVFKKGKLDRYAMLLSVLDDRFTDEFLKRFEPFFQKFVSADSGLWYNHDTNYEGD